MKNIIIAIVLLFPIIGYTQNDFTITNASPCNLIMSDFGGADIDENWLNNELTWIQTRPNYLQIRDNERTFTIREDKIGNLFNEPLGILDPAPNSIADLILFLEQTKTKCLELSGGANLDLPICGTNSIDTFLNSNISPITTNATIQKLASDLGGTAPVWNTPDLNLFSAVDAQNYILGNGIPTPGSSPALGATIDISQPCCSIDSIYVNVYWDTLSWFTAAPGDTISPIFLMTWESNPLVPLGDSAVVLSTVDAPTNFYSPGFNQFYSYLFYPMNFYIEAYPPNPSTPVGGSLDLSFIDTIDFATLVPDNIAAATINAVYLSVRYSCPDTIVNLVYNVYSGEIDTLPLTGSGGANIYNTDGTLTGNRQIEGTGYNINFENQKEFNVTSVYNAPANVAQNLIRSRHTLNNTDAYENIVADENSAYIFETVETVAGTVQNAIFASNLGVSSNIEIQDNLTTDYATFQVDLDGMRISGSDGGFNYSYGFPEANGTNGQVLANDGFGNLSWQTVTAPNIGNTNLVLTSDRTLSGVTGATHSELWFNFMRQFLVTSYPFQDPTGTFSRINLFSQPSDGTGTAGIQIVTNDAPRLSIIELQANDPVQNYDARISVDAQNKTFMEHKDAFGNHSQINTRFNYISFEGENAGVPFLYYFPKTQPADGQIFKSDAFGNMFWSGDATIYNTDGTLTGTRQVNGNGEVLRFDGMDAVRFQNIQDFEVINTNAAIYGGLGISVGESGVTNAINVYANNEINYISPISNFQGSTIKMAALPPFADDAAAGLGGLTQGELYRTDGTGAAPLNVAGIVMVKL